MPKTIQELVEYTEKPDDSDLLILWRSVAGVTRSTSFLNLLRDRWTETTAVYTTLANDKLLANTTASAFTIDLPLNPTAGDTIGIVDSHGQWNTNNLTIGRNGENIRGAASDVVLNTQWQEVTCVYVDSTIGWIYY
jgi:hypothetical protein